MTVDPLVKARHENIIKSAEDKRLYRGLELHNGLRVLLVSDPTTDKSAASMDVNVGQLTYSTLFNHYRSSTGSFVAILIEIWSQNFTIGKEKNGAWSRNENHVRWNDFISGSHHWRKLELAKYHWGVENQFTESRNDNRVSLYSAQNVDYRICSFISTVLKLFRFRSILCLYIWMIKFQQNQTNFFVNFWSKNCKTHTRTNTVVNILCFSAQKLFKPSNCSFRYLWTYTSDKNEEYIAFLYIHTIVCSSLGP